MTPPAKLQSTGCQNPLCLEIDWHKIRSLIAMQQTDPALNLQATKRLSTPRLAARAIAHEVNPEPIIHDGHEREKRNTHRIP